jgi:hypothetical protein
MVVFDRYVGGCIHIDVDQIDVVDSVDETIHIKVAFT